MDTTTGPLVAGRLTAMAADGRVRRCIGHGWQKTAHESSRRVNLLNLSRYKARSRQSCAITPWRHQRDQGLDFSIIRILMAEDDDVMREYMARALSSAGYYVTPVDHSTATVPFFASGHFDPLLS